MSKFTHQNGLVFSSREALSVDRTQDGFLIRPQGFRDLRSPFVIKVSLGSDRPAEAWTNSRHLDADTVYYRIDSDPGGSGGEVQTLTAWKAMPNAYVLLTCQVQSENSKREDFDVGWSVMSHLRLTEPRH